MSNKKSAGQQRFYVNILVYTMLGFYSTLMVLHLIRLVTHWSRKSSSPSEKRTAANQLRITRAGKLSTWLKRYLTRPALAGETHAAWKAIGILPPVSMPTRYESLLIFTYFLFNIVLGSAGHDSLKSGVLKSISYRQASLALVNTAFLSLHAGRNSPIVLLADLDFRTSILMHRYIGRMTIAQVALHGSVQLYFILKNGPSILRHFWQARPIVGGFFAFLAGLIILVQSIGPLRRAFYECFRVSPYLSVYVMKN